MAYVVGSVVDAAGFRSRINSMISSIIPSGHRDSSTSELWGIWSSYLTTRDQLISDLMYTYDNYISGRPAQGGSLSAWSAWVALWNIFAQMYRFKVYIWDDLGSAAPGSQTSAAQRAIDYQNAGVTGGSGWAYFKSNFAWNNTGLNYRPAAVANANTDNNGCEWYPGTSTNWNTHVYLDPGVTQPSNLSTGALVELTNSIENTITALNNEFNTRNANTVYFWDGNTTTQASAKVLCVRYWCHTNCHNNCHSNCHKNRSRR